MPVGALSMMMFHGEEGLAEYAAGGFVLRVIEGWENAVFSRFINMHCGGKRKAYMENLFMN